MVLLQQLVQVFFPKVGCGRAEKEVDQVGAGVAPPENGDIDQAALGRNIIDVPIGQEEVYICNEVSVLGGKFDGLTHLNNMLLNQTSP